MSRITIAPTVSSDVAERTLDLAPVRLLTFLRGAAEPAIRTSLAPVGWSEERLDEGWSLLSELRDMHVGEIETHPLAAGIARCEAWQMTGLVRSRAMLQLSHPDQARALFDDLVATKGIGTVLDASLFLDRHCELPDEVKQVLEEAGNTKSALAQLQDAVDAVQRPAAIKVVPDHRTTQLLVLRRIHAWVTAWSEMARTVVRRRDHLIRLGIANRRSPKPRALPVAV